MDQDKAAAILKALEEGESLRKAASAQGISPGTVLYWTKTDAAFLEQYTRAREIGYRLLADEILDISDQSENDTYTDDDGNVRVNNEVVARARLRVDSRKWMLSKMLPKIYGDKLELSGDPDKPLQTSLTVTFK